MRQIQVFGGGGGLKKSKCDEKERILFTRHVADHTINKLLITVTQVQSLMSRFQTQIKNMQRLLYIYLHVD